MEPSPGSSPSDQFVESLQNLSITSPAPDGTNPVAEANIVEDLPNVTAKPHEMLATSIQYRSNFYMPTSCYDEVYGWQSQMERNPSRHLNHETAAMLPGSHRMYHHGYPYVPFMTYTPPASPASTQNEVQSRQYPTQYYNPSDQARSKSNSDKEGNVAPWLYGTNSRFYSTMPPANFPLRGKTDNHHPLPSTLQAKSSSTFNDGPGTMNPMYPTNVTYSGQVNTSGAGFRSDRKGQDYGRGTLWNANRTADIFDELRTGPRSNGGNWKGGEITAETKEQSLSEDNNIENLSPEFLNKKNFDGENFPEEYSCAKFFVIKSYSEDDVHKSIKYGFWASTPNGNKKLDVAFQDAKQNLGESPVFLFFSVNASGKFVGLAEMVGPVDFDKTLEYWQQYIWRGCIPVKWHIIKDVNNRSLVHIKLKNNRNKSVTYSRDTEEVEFEQGMEMLKIFKSKPLTTTILDDFGFYDNRERLMQEYRAKFKKNKSPMPAVGSGDSATATVEKAIVDTEESQAGRGRSPSQCDEVLAKESTFGGVS